jgi:hypothetical protein
VQRADPVEQHVDPDAGARPLGQRVGERLRHGAVRPEVLSVVDRRARGTDRAQERGKDLIAVQQQVDAVARHRGRAEMRFERADERGIADGQGGEALDAW